MLGMLSCENNSKINTSNSETDEIGNIDQIKEIEVEKNTKIEDEKREILPFKEVMSKKEIVKYLFIVDTLWYSRTEENVDLVYNEIIGLMTERNSNFHYIKNSFDKDLEKIFHYNDSMVLIPFHSHLGGESTFFTKWIVVNEDSLKYDGYIKKSFGTKYASVYILEKTIKNNIEYFIGKTKGGEGGDTFETIWLAKYNGIDNLKILYKYSVDYNGGDSISPSINYKVLDEELTILHRKNLVIYEKKSTVEEFLEENIVKTIIFEELK